MGVGVGGCVCVCAHVLHKQEVQLVYKTILVSLQFVQKVNTIYDRHGLGRRTRSLLY